ncbi:hypothetical protein FH972_026583 [Carpinus fangiana]|uniref:DNA-directed RNA polymerase n=1 Tax=Carpinus fangiana TaxID=176857 RepID=A0A5N6L5C7_9ROSI|nr:hypothetical protein FH972_026583 [Carpinus fangiana]
MLTRAARQHSRHRISHHVAASYAQLHLPWLCPAVNRDLGSRRHIATPPSPPSRPLPTRQHSTPDFSSHQRRLASAAAEPSYSASPYDTYVPFARTPDTSSIPSLSEPWQYGSDPVQNPIRPRPRHAIDSRFRSSPRYHFTGDLTERLQHFYACIRAGRLDRAAILIKDLQQSLSPDQPELTDAHEQYLTSMLENQLEMPTRERFVEMQKWLELDVRGRQTPLTASMISTLIKASLVSLQGTQQERTIRRYLTQATESGPGIEEDTLASSLFSEEDLAQVLALAPHQYHHYQAVASDLVLEEDADVDVWTASSYEAAQYAEDSEAPGASSDLAELKSTEQKGLGLNAVKKSLTSMSLLDVEHIDPEEAKANAILVQESIEHDVVAAALERWRSENKQTQDHRLGGALAGRGGPGLGSHIYGWIERMKVMIQSDLQKAQVMEQKEAPAEMRDLLWVAPHLAPLSAEEIAGAAVIGYMGGLVDASSKARLPGDALIISLRRLCHAIASTIEDELKIKLTFGTRKQMLKSVPSPERRRRIARLLRKPRPISTQSPAEAERLIEQRDLINHVNLPIESSYKLGAIVLEWLVKSATIPHTRVDPITGREQTETVQVMEIGTAWAKGKLFGVVRTHEAMVEKMKREPNERFISKYLPMVVEPRPWKGLRDGAYLKTETTALRFSDHSGSQMDYLSIAEQRGDLDGVFKALDVIGKVPWRINGPLFEVLTNAWNTGEPLAGLAPEDPVEVIPPEPSREDKAAHVRWQKIARQAHNETVGMHSQRCYQNSQFEVARAYLGKTFYCPHSIDFRGRAYPIPPYFNHMGADYIRSLFMFAKGKPLGDDGLRWLKIHLSNVYGFDKESLKDREQFPMEHIDDIFDSATNPLNGRRWWMTAGDPWQCLAACMELKNALDSPVPAQFVSHLPIQQDGSCNGLQHYAALGGDEIGAQQVNLVPGDKPADIYSSVADLVRGYVDEDAKKGVMEAKAMVGHVSRKVVKQPVMTNVYGVTFMGAAAQIKKQLVDILPKESLDNNIDVARVARYTAKLVFRALGEMFNGAQAIQHWLGESAGKISSVLTPEQITRLREQMESQQDQPAKRAVRTNSWKSDKLDDRQFKSGVIWTTPLGLPVVQPYREHLVKQIATTVKQMSVAIVRSTDPVNKRKQFQGFPPNFIHSLDATHMMLSAMKCDEVGLQFASVHDSFWTHAADVPVMNRILRDAFVRMHSDDVVRRLREELIARYEGCMQWAHIRESSELGQKVKRWYQENGFRAKNFHTPSTHDDLQIKLCLREADRQKLLASEDLKEQGQGRAMVTPCSIIEDHGGLDAAIAADTAAEAEYAARQEAQDLERALDTDTADLQATDVFESADVIASVEDDTEVEPLSAKPILKDEGSLKSVRKTKSRSSKEKQQSRRKLYFWAPIQFSPAPKKGAFDVSQLKDSQYFFS